MLDLYPLISYGEIGKLQELQGRLPMRELLVFKCKNRQGVECTYSIEGDRAALDVVSRAFEVHNWEEDDDKEIVELEELSNA